VPPSGEPAADGSLVETLSPSRDTAVATVRAGPVPPAGTPALATRLRAS